MSCDGLTTFHSARALFGRDGWERTFRRGVASRKKYVFRSGDFLSSIERRPRRLVIVRENGSYGGHTNLDVARKTRRVRYAPIVHWSAAPVAAQSTLARAGNSRSRLDVSPSVGQGAARPETSILPPTERAQRRMERHRERERSTTPKPCPPIRGGSSVLPPPPLLPLLLGETRRPMWHCV